MKGRGRGRGGSKGRGSRRPKGRASSSRSSGSNNNSTKKKSLSDHMYYVGSAKQASDFVTCTNFIINHIRQTYLQENDIATALEKLEDTDFDALLPTIQTSDSEDAAEAAMQNRMYDNQYQVLFKEHTARKSQHRQNTSKAEALLWSQCATMMKSKILSRVDYEKEIKGNPIKLLEAIKQHALSYESTQYRMKTICDSMKSLINLKQKADHCQRNDDC